jgi:DNA-binding PadR family transcriptional regulator
MAREKRVEINATAASLLGFLQNEPMSGWDLTARVREIIGDFWNVTKSQIYKELKVLAERGYVVEKESGPRDKHVFGVTPSGRAAFRAWIKNRPDIPNMRLPIVLTVFFGDALPPEDMRSILEQHRAHHEERLRVYRSFPAQEGTWPYEALRMGILFQEAVLKWIDGMPEGVRPQMKTIVQKGRSRR